MARTFTEGYRLGFEAAGIDLSKKKTVNIRYFLGQERMIRAAILQFEQMGLVDMLPICGKQNQQETYTQDRLFVKRS